MDLTTADAFEPWLGRALRVECAPEPVEITLVEIARQPPIAGLERVPFILIFETAWEIYLSDNAYMFDFGLDEPVLIGISQLQPSGQTRRYQAVFA